MTEVLLTPLLTVVSGVLLFTIGQIVVILFIERVRKQARTIEAIAEGLVIYGREYTNPVELSQVTSEHREVLETASVEFRRLSAVLRATATTLRWYPLFERFRLVAPRKNVIEASTLLMRLSNLIPPKHDMLETAVDDAAHIKKLLEIIVKDQD